MLKNYFSIICLCILALVSCTSDDLAEVQDVDGIVHFSAHIESPRSITRAVTDLDGKGHFTNGDVITLSYLQNQTALTFFNGKWTPELKWENIPGESATFSAFYPQVNHNHNTFVHQVEVNQQLGDHYENSDLLFADPVSVNKGQTVELKFRHLMSHLTVELRSNVYTPEQLANAEVQVKGYNKIDVNPDGSLGKLYNYKYVNNVPEIVMKSRGNGVFQAIICPQNVHEFSYGQWWLKIKVEGQEYNVQEAPQVFKDGAPFNGFEAGKTVTLKYNLNKNTVDEVWGGKTVWVYGLQNMPEPHTDAWKQYYEYKGTIFKHLPWNSKYGWYDANKNYLSNPQNGFDQNLCWAASASNMLHWWLDRNKENVDRYCRLNNIPPSSIPRVFHNRNNSEVFNVFKKNFQNHGSWPDEGLKWFLWGSYSKKGNGADLLGKDGGYFKDVFNDNSKLVRTMGIGKMDHFSEQLKIALNNHEAIGFNIEFENLPAGHALTIWGATFDEYGTVTTIYYTENNDGDLTQDDRFNNGLLASRVGEYDGPKELLKGRACLANSQGSARLPIRELVMLRIGEDVWKDYFDKHSN